VRYCAVRRAMKPRTSSRHASSNLPARTTSFVGRSEDLSALSAHFEQARLVTIVGPGGMGKTSLALRFANDELPAYTTQRGGGVWLTELTEARDARDVIAAVAATLGVSLVGLESEAALSDAVGRAIARRGRVLLVLDNFDRLTAHAPITVGAWLASAPSARLLVTSRTALDVTGEQLWPLAPLPSAEAVALFARRVREVQPSFDEASASDEVQQIVELIDRLPLAIELAATRMTILSSAQLRDRLARPLDILAGRRAPERHGSMRRTVLDSVEVLPPGTRRLFAMASVMRNGFTLEAAEAILGDLVVPRADVMNELDALVRSSLLRTSTRASDVARYAYFETIRDVAEETCATDPARDELLRRHVSYYATLCARGSRDAVPRASDLDALELELENVLRAHRHAIALASCSEHAPAADAAVIALGLEPLLSARGLSELRAELFDATLAALDAVGSPDLARRAEAHLARGLAHRELGDASLAREDFERALDLSRHASQPGLAAVALMRLGGIDDLVGDTELARRRFDEALALLGSTPRGRLRTLREAETYLRVGHAHRREGDLDRARGAIVASIDRYRSLGRDEGLASAIYELAVIEIFAARYDEAFASFEEGFRVAQRGRIRVMTGALETARGCLLQDVGRLDEALDHHAEAARIFREVGSRYREASALYYLATTHLERGNAAEAESILHRALERVEGVGAPRYEALMAGCSAAALSLLGQSEAAERAMTRAESAARRVRSEPALESNLRVHRLALDLEAGRRDAASAIAEAEKLVAAHASDDSRFALRALRLASRGAPSGADALVVAEGGAAFTLPGASEPIVLPERSPLRRILEHLAERRLEAPGEVVTLDDVIRVGWPSEKIAALAALNRAHVALATLRKKGLREHLVSGGGGYALSRAVVVRLERPDGVKRH